MKPLMDAAGKRSAARRSIGYVACVVTGAVLAAVLLNSLRGDAIAMVEAYAAIGVLSLAWTFIVDKPKGSTALAAFILCGLFWPLAVLLASLIALMNFGALRQGR